MIKLEQNPPQLPLESSQSAVDFCGVLTIGELARKSNGGARGFVLYSAPNFQHKLRLKLTQK